MSCFPPDPFVGWCRMGADDGSPGYGSCFACCSVGWHCELSPFDADGLQRKPRRGLPYQPRRIWEHQETAAADKGRQRRLEFDGWAFETGVLRLFIPGGWRADARSAERPHDP